MVSETSPRPDILERAKAADIDSLACTDWGALREIVQGLIAEVERLRSEIEIDNKLLADRDRIYEVCQCPVHGSCTPYVIEQLKSIPEKDARIKELEVELEKIKTPHKSYPPLFRIDEEFPETSMED